MKTVKNIGLIECGISLKPHYLSQVASSDGISVKKVLLTTTINEGNIKSKYPQAEVVDNTKEILNDSSIDLVIVSGASQNDMGIVGEIIQSGKHMRII